MVSLTTHRLRKLSGTISTDDIIPGRYKHMYTDPAAMAPHVFENFHAGFARTLRPGDALWCPEIFGVGSSREQAITSLLATGVDLVLAPQFGRIFYRNCWNLGLLPLQVASLDIPDGATLTVDLALGLLTGPGDYTAQFIPPEPEMLQMRSAGGLLAYVKMVGLGWST